MKAAITLILCALALTGCATSNEAYYKAISDREDRLAQQDLRADTAIAEMAAKGDDQAKGMGLMYFALKAAGAKNTQPIAAPESVSDKVLRWAAVLVPGFTQVYAIQQNARVQTHLSDNSVKAQGSSNEMIVDLVQGRKTPIVGEEGDVLLYGN
jgi:hypothetical protein